MQCRSSSFERRGEDGVVVVGEDVVDARVVRAGRGGGGVGYEGEEGGEAARAEGRVVGEGGGLLLLGRGLVYGGCGGRGVGGG